MNTGSRTNKSKRRPAPVQLTENEIQDYIAHDDDDSGSDWDDVGVTDASEFLSSNATLCEKSRQPRPVFTTSLAKQPSSVSTNVTPCSTDNFTRLKDVGIEQLFSANLATNSTDVQDSADMDRLFGSDSESDFGDLDALGEEDDDKFTLSEPGTLIKKSLSATEKKRREAQIERHVQEHLATEASIKSDTSLEITDESTPRIPKHDSSKQQTNSSRTKSQTPTASTSTSTAPSTPEGWIAVPTNLRVSRPVISSELWSNRTQGRTVFNLVQFIQRQRSQSFIEPPVKRSRSSSTTDDSVLVAVIGSKLPPRRSRNDRIYSVWCLSDLNQVGPGSQMGCVKLFLFGNCHEKLWKEPDGSVVAVLGPRLMSDAGAYDDKDLGITLQSPQHLMILGQSPDFGVCAATSKSGQACFRVINKSACRYCDVHVKKAYFEASASRPGFFDYNLSVFKNHRPRRYRGDVPPPRDPNVYSLPTSNMFSDGSGSYKVPPSRVKLNMSKLSAAGYTVDVSAGLGGSAEPKRPTGSNDPRSPGSSTALTSPEQKLLKALRKPTAGSLNLLRHLQCDPESNDPNSTTVLSTTATSTTSHSSIATGSKSGSEKVTTTFSQFFASASKQRSPAPLSRNENFIDLGPLPKSTTPISAARLRAAALVKSKGGLKAMESQSKLKQIEAALEQQLNSTTRQTGSSPLGEILNPNKLTSRLPPTDASSVETKSVSVPKNMKRLERLAALAEQVRQGSSHAKLIDDVENVNEQVRLASLEKRDEMEQKLVNQTEERCTFVKCKTCNYRAWRAKPDCRSSNHQLVYLKGVKRYFRCRNCLKRTITFERYPTDSCSNCGESLFEKCGIIRERKGPELPGEKLLPRGLEEKYLG